MKTRRMMVMGKMKVKVKVKDEDEDVFCYPCFDWVGTVDPPPVRYLLMLGLPRPACLRDPYHGKAITPTSLQLARYRANGTATAAIGRLTLLMPRYSENDAATAVLCGKLLQAKLRRNAGCWFVCDS